MDSEIIDLSDEPEIIDLDDVDDPIEISDDEEDSLKRKLDSDNESQPQKKRKIESEIARTTFEVNEPNKL